MNKNENSKYISLTGARPVNSLSLIIDNINAELKNNYLLGALALSLTIPDIGGQIEFSKLVNEKGKRLVGKQYEQWFDKWIGNFEKCGGEEKIEMPYMSGKLIYSLRCALFHSGNNDVSIEYKNLKLDNLILKFESKNKKDLYIERSGAIKIDQNTYTYYLISVRNICIKMISAAKMFIKECNEKNIELPSILITDENK